VLARQDVPRENIIALWKLHDQLNPAELKRTIGKLQDKLFDLAANKELKRKQHLLKELKCTNCSSS
jgi:hypothetical protein